MRKQLAEVAEGKRFLLQGGDCAERFADCSASVIENKLRIILQVGVARPIDPTARPMALGADVSDSHVGRQDAYLAHRADCGAVLEAALCGLRGGRGL